jgi:hypothetical protein
MVGVAAFSGSLRGLKSVPLKWRDLVPPRRVELCRDHPRLTQTIGRSHHYLSPLLCIPNEAMQIDIDYYIYL